MLWKLTKVCVLGALAFFLIAAVSTAIVYWSSKVRPITPTQGIALVNSCPVFTEAGAEIRKVIAISQIVQGDQSLPHLFHADAAWRPQNSFGQVGTVFHSSVAFEREGGSWVLLAFTDITGEHTPGTTVETQGRCPKLKD